MAIDSTSSAAGSNPAWLRGLMPSVGDLIFLALLGLLAFTNLSVRLLGDAGIGWHIRTGQLILATHTIPRIDPFSSSLNGQPWFAWEWLYDVFAGWLDSAAGLNGVVLLTALIIAFVFSWTFRLILRRGANLAVAFVLVLLAASASMIHFFARPHVVSWLFTLAWFWILESSEDDSGEFGTEPAPRSHSGRSRRLYLLPLLMLLWVNLHGGFLLGFALLAIYWLKVAGLWLRLTLKLADAQFADLLLKIRAGRRVQALTWAGILCALATFVNPYGFRLHIHVYRYLSNRFLMDHIDEFQSPNFHLVAQKCFAGLLLLALVALAAKRRAADVRHVLLVLFAAFSGLWAARNIPVASLLLVLVIAPWLSEAMESLGRRREGHRTGRNPYSFLHRMKAMELNIRGHLWPVVATVLVCFVTFQGGKLGSRLVMNAHFDTQRFPAAAANYIEENNIQGPVLAPDYWGGYFIYRFDPRRKVVVDDRHDFYGEKFLRSYLKFIHIEPGWDDFLRQNPAQCVVMPKDSAVANILLETPGWQPVYRDDVAIVFVPVTAKGG